LQIQKAGAIYFAVVFGTGFILGPLRILWLVPRVGERTAELIETPIMLLVIVFAARWVARRFARPSTAFRLLGMGLVALSFLLFCEFTFVLYLRGLNIHEYFANRDPMAGTVYLVMLGLFVIMPVLFARRRNHLR
jgi:hypothetical protein